MQTEYEFVLPRGYLDDTGAVHRRGTMRLATARDELEPLRDPTMQGPDDPRLTILVLARVVKTLGTMVLVTPFEIEGLFAADLAYLQDFYGVINFGTEEEIQAVLEAQREMLKPATAPAAMSASVPVPDSGGARPVVGERPSLMAERGGERLTSRRSAIEEVPASGR